MSRFPVSLLFLVPLLSAPALGAGEMSAKEKSKVKAEIRQDVQATLKKLYKVQPSARPLISKSAGYAVFNNFGMKILVTGGGSGKGIAFEKSGRQTFMKMIEMQAGLGMGAKKFSLVWVFADQAGFKKFLSGSFEMSGQANATAQKDSKGGAYAGALSISPGVWLYQLQGDGLAAELTAKGTKYYLWDELNK